VKAIDFDKLVPIKRMQGETSDETNLLQGHYQEAEAFIRSFAWCRSIIDCYYRIGIGGIFAIFLFRIVPTSINVDEYLWVIVGDLPPAYLVTDLSPTPAGALRIYIGEMQRWVDAVQKGKPITDVIPVNVPPTAEYAEQLERRLEFLRLSVLPQVANSH